MQARDTQYFSDIDAHGLTVPVVNAGDLHAGLVVERPQDREILLLGAQDCHTYCFIRHWLAELS
jgi:hypothetical protein